MTHSTDEQFPLFYRVWSALDDGACHWLSQTLWDIENRTIIWNVTVI